MAPNAASIAPYQGSRTTGTPAKHTPEFTCTIQSTKQPASTRTDSILSECEALKRKIRRERPVKTSRFSLSHMKRVAIPPVAIPLSFTTAPTVVAGKRVLFTRESFERRKYERQLLRRIREDEMLRL